jgi:predicted nuclease of restriction endonuclease-like (RecB) superfamily
MRKAVAGSGKTTSAKPAPVQPMDDAFAEVLCLIQSARQRAYQAVNSELVSLYWQIGEYISLKIASDGWGKGTIINLSTFIQRAQPGIRGFSAQNLWRMRQFHETYRGQPILSALLRELPWTHHLVIMGQSKRDEEREFYLRLAIREKWSSRELERQFRTGLFARTILSPPKLSSLVRELHPDALNIFKNAYSLEFLGLPEAHSEADLHGALLRNLGRFITFAEYETQLPDKKLLQAKLHEFYQLLAPSEASEAPAFPRKAIRKARGSQP